MAVAREVATASLVAASVHSLASAAIIALGIRAMVTGIIAIEVVWPLARQLAMAVAAWGPRTQLPARVVYLPHLALVLASVP